MRRLPKILLGLLVLGLPLALLGLFSEREAPPVRARLIAASTEPDGFARAEGPASLVFPEDHGPHPDYQTEWWYYTGNLETQAGDHFGYQLTIFRRAILPAALRAERQSNWGTDQVYMAHFALTDVSGGRYQAAERIARGAAGLAGAQAAPYRVWLEDWQIAEIGPNRFRLQATHDRLSLDLRLSAVKEPVLQGEGGYSRKGPEPGNASYYYSYTRLETAGLVQIGSSAYEVSGLSWMDHEFSTNALSPEQVGWDWFAFQLDDGSELMVFQLRRADGRIDPFSSGLFVGPDGRTRRLSRDAFDIEVTDTWRSPHTAAVYPARWTVSVPQIDLTLTVRPYLPDQELVLSYVYWEGAVRLEGERAGRAVKGSGYAELTGYVSSMAGQF